LRGKRIKEIRELMKMTQAEFGEKLGFNWSKIKDLESGKLNTTAEIALLIEKIYSVNLRWLLTGEGEMFCSSDSPLASELPDKIKKIVQELPLKRQKRIFEYIEDQRDLSKLLGE